MRYGCLMKRCAHQISATLLLAVWTCSGAHADALPLTRTVSLGRPAHPVQIALTTQGEERRLTLQIAGARKSLPVRGARAVTLERVAIAPDAAVAIVDVLAEDGHWRALLGGRSGAELLTLVHAEPSGDPGEQVTPELLQVGPVVRTGSSFEGVSLCGQRPVLFDAQQLDPLSLRLTPAAPLPPLREAPSEGRVELTTEAPHPPLLDALVAVASSERDAITHAPRAPRGLVQSAPQSAFVVRPGSFALLRWEAIGLPIERLALTVAGPADRALTLLWVGDHSPPLRTTIPAAAGATRHVRITPPAPIPGSCLALLVADGAGSDLTLAALRAYSSLDQEGGLEALLDRLTLDGREGAEAADLLAKLGPEQAEKLALRWDALSPLARQRGLKLLARGLEHEVVRARVIETARTGESALRGVALGLLARSGPAGREALRALATEPGEAGDEAAELLARSGDEHPSLVAALGRGGAERPRLRQALATAARRAPARFAQAVRSALAQPGDVAGRAALALAAAEAGQSALAAEIAGSYAARAERFEDRYRFALAVAVTDGQPTAQHAELDAWLASQARDASEWMQRRAALDALVARAAPESAKVAARLVDDAYPRVRVAAMAPLARAGRADLVAHAARADAWPLVRAAAVHALARDASQDDAVLDALEDRSARVRAAAVEALTTRGERTAWPRVHARLVSKQEARVVREAAVGFAASLCIADAREPLRVLAEEGIGPGASDEATQLGTAALRALHALGGESARDGAQIVARSATPALQRMWSRLGSSRCDTPRS